MGYVIDIGGAGARPRGLGRAHKGKKPRERTGRAGSTYTAKRAHDMYDWKGQMSNEGSDLAQGGRRT